MDNCDGYPQKKGDKSPMSAPSSTHETSAKLTTMSNDPAFTPPPSNSNTRVPPHNVDAEASLLGAMLLSRDAIGPAVETLSGEQFYVPAHGYIFDAIASLYLSLIHI